jgi:hypothetical protein
MIVSVFLVLKGIVSRKFHILLVTFESLEGSTPSLLLLLRFHVEFSHIRCSTVSPNTVDEFSYVAGFVNSVGS